MPSPTYVKGSWANSLLVGVWDEEDKRSYEACLLPNIYSNYYYLFFDYYKGIELRYPSSTAYLIGRLTFRHARAYWSNQIAQWAFNKKSLEARTTFEVLEWLVQNKMENSSFKFSTWDILGVLYGKRISGHPNAESLHNRYQFILEGLVCEGLVKNELTHYTVSPRALLALEERQEEDRRRREANRLQFALVVLTGVIAVTGILGPFLRQ